MAAFLCGALGACFVLGAFLAGAFSGWFFRGKVEQKEIEVAEAVSEEQRRKVEEYNLAFEQQMGYNLDMVYGLGEFGKDRGEQV